MFEADRQLARGLVVLPRGGHTKSTQIVIGERAAVHARGMQAIEPLEDGFDLLGGDDRAVDALLRRSRDERLSLVLLRVDFDAQIESIDAVLAGADARGQRLR